LNAGKWDRHKFLGRELFGKTLGIIGLGRVGSRVAVRAKSFGMNVIAYDPYIKKEKATSIGVELLENFEDLIKAADIITVHTPLTEETRNMISAKEIAKMKDGVYLINCARGGIINEKDLASALKSGKVAGAAIDVFSSEPPKEIELIGMENVVVTPHLGGNTTEAQRNVSEMICRQIINAVQQNIYENAVNLPFMHTEIAPETLPYIQLAEAMGKFIGQFVKGRIYEIRIEARGEAKNIDAISTAALKGILEPVMKESVNYINAKYLAVKIPQRYDYNNSKE